MNRGDLEGMLELFAPGAWIHHPTGVYADPEAMRDFFSVGMGARVELQVRRVLAEEACCLVEFAARVPGDPDWGQEAANVFSVDARGRLRSVDIYYRRPHRLPQGSPHAAAGPGSQTG